ncbi:hypothetical protein XU18_0065 [Perkinsela sp. CCAP 1560/4]|nr:hypothetical protein XU18_0065 [Perkinsela sp. CCAP 1560/4]|eukprot:KNH09380.1 hypothetical protein XU18_0065 [Perkinsela sp. CCAP 1560/4]
MRLISLGGWCGPSQAIAKLGLRNDSEPLSPFEFVRCSMDAVTKFTASGRLDGFFPAPAEVDPVSIWLLFRGKHTCFTHFDIRKPHVQEDFTMRMEFYQMLLRSNTPLLFVRTAISCNPQHELDEIERFQNVLSSIRPRGAVSRVVLIVHDQKLPQTQQLFHHDPNLMLWSLEYSDSADNAGLFSRSHQGYENILLTAIREETWGDKKKKNCLRDFRFRCHQNLSHVEGVPIFTYNCIGYGTTLASHAKKDLLRSCNLQCSTCEEDSLHVVKDEGQWDSASAWTNEEDAALAHVKRKLGLLDDNLDIVQFVEAFSNKHKRSARQTLGRIEQLQ